jgi:hypothetical protein
MYRFIFQMYEAKEISFKAATKLLEKYERSRNTRKSSK